MFIRAKLQLTGLQDIICIPIYSQVNINNWKRRDLTQQHAVTLSVFICSSIRFVFLLSVSLSCRLIVLQFKEKRPKPCDKSETVLQKEKTTSVHFVAPWETSDVVIWHQISLFYLAGSEHCGVPLYSYNDHTTCVSTCDERKSRDGWVGGGLERCTLLMHLLPSAWQLGCNDQMRRLWHLQFASDAHAMSGEKAIKLGCSLSLPAAACHLPVCVIVNCLYLIWSMYNMQGSVTNVPSFSHWIWQLTIHESKNNCSQVAIFVCMCTLRLTLASCGK